MALNSPLHLVRAYRLIGFDNKRSALADSSSELEGGEIGSGHSMIAIFEIDPTDENKAAMSVGAMSKQIASARIHYRLPEGKALRYSSFQCPYNYLEFKESRSFLRFAASVALFGSMLRNSDYVRNVSWQELVNMTADCADHSNNLQKEFYEMVLKAQKIYQPLKKKNK